MKNIFKSQIKFSIIVASFFIFTACGGGGGGASGGSDSVQAPTAEAAPAAKQTVTISLQGEVFGAKQVRDLIEKINDATKNGAILNMV